MRNPWVMCSAKGARVTGIMIILYWYASMGVFRTSRVVFWFLMGTKNSVFLFFQTTNKHFYLIKQLYRKMFLYFICF